MAIGSTNMRTKQMMKLMAVQMKVILYGSCMLSSRLLSRVYFAQEMSRGIAKIR